MKAYKLLKEMPGLNAGAVFVHDESDQEKGSIGHGCLKLAWKAGGTQDGWCGETHVLPGQLAKNREWFTEIENKPTYYV